MTKQSFRSHEDRDVADGHKTTLGKALPIQYGKSRSTTYGVAKQETPVYGSSGQIGTFDRALTNGPTLIVGRKGSAGAVHYSPTACWPIDTVYYAQEILGTHLPFFQYLIEHLKLGKLDKSTTIPSLSRDDYNATEAFIPSVDKQREIVADIEKQFSRLDEAVANLKRVKANLKRYKAAVLRAGVEGRLVPTEAELARDEGRTYETGTQLLQRILEARRSQWKGKGKYKEPTAPDTTGLPDLPVGWVWTTVEQAGDVLLGRQRAPQYLTGQFTQKYLRVANIKDDFIDLADVESMDFNDDHFKKYALQRGDILVSEGQSPELLGQSAIFRGHDVPLFFQKTLHRFRASAGVTTAEFAQIVFRSHVKSGVFRRIGSITTNIGHLTLEKFVKAPFSMPPVTEQHRIVAEVDRRLSLVSGVEAEVDANLKRAERLRQSVLQHEFETKD